MAGHSGLSYPRSAAALGVSHEALNLSAGERVRGELHIQTVNRLHERIKTFLRRRRGIATKYLDNYLRWFHREFPDTQRLLNAAIGPKSHRQCLISAN